MQWNIPSSCVAQVKMFAPNVDQMDVVNHCEGNPQTEKRNVLLESARIARGKVTDLAKLDVDAFDVLIIPGELTMFTHTYKQGHKHTHT